MKFLISTLFVFGVLYSVEGLPQSLTGKRSEIALPATNAERLKRGLPLKPPVQRTTAIKAARSGLPPPVFTNSELYGFVSISSGSTQVGYLQCTASCNLVPITESYDATSVRFTPNDLNGGGQPFTITYDGGHLPDIGGHVFQSTGELGPGSPGEARLDSVAVDQPGAHPSSGAVEFTEASIWKYTQSTGLLVPTWIDSSDDGIDTYIMADPNGDLYLSGDVDEFEAKHGAGSSGPLTFHFPAQFTVPPRSRR
ncbi:hypothetical protein CALVIDRAFT_565873 [Calocera viscosa TUFC12733]|uniref:Acid protease n=1 Tax=Calocera viscosa (strain TUFC12733) TaxID=1330018 RepID=A0A167K3C4_CALVF|nr:hypothetical protein CALVIDRAFT_565873 [Calocera viscosa TUFC12733]